MLGTPKITIKNFSGISENGVYWCEGFNPKKTNGQSILTQGWGTNVVVDKTDTGFSSLIQEINDMCRYHHVSFGHVLAISNEGKLYDIEPETPANSIGLIHDTSTDPTVYGSVFQTKKNNILYTTKDYMGYAVLGQMTSSTTTKIVDTTKDFTALGFVVGDKVYNLTKKEEYTITSITTTTNSNDTLNFSAGTAGSANDWYIIFDDNKFAFTTANYPHFYGQESTSSFHRQIFQIDSVDFDNYYVLNGNYLGKISNDETTWGSDILNEEYKMLPEACQATSASVNQGQVLIAAKFRGKGKLLLWNGYSDGWLSIIETEGVIADVKRYDTGWVVLIGRTYYFTNGYSLQFLSKLPETDYLMETLPNFNLLAVADDNIITSISILNNNRYQSGLYIYSIKEGSFKYASIKKPNGNLARLNPYCVFQINYQQSNTAASKLLHLFYAEDTIEATAVNFIGNLAKSSNNKSLNSEYSSLLIYVKLPQKITITGIELNISPKYEANIVSNKNNLVTVNYGKGQNAMYGDLIIESSSTKSVLKIDGSSVQNEVGQKILIKNGVNSYQECYITAIENKGTSNEEITIYPELTNTPEENSGLIRFDLYKAGEKTVNSNIVPDEMYFPVDEFYSDKFFLEVVFKNQDDFPLDLHAINIY